MVKSYSWKNLVAGFVILAAMLVTVQRYLSSPAQRVPEAETKAAAADHGYIHMDPSGKGFVYDDGTPFIPNAPNAYRILQRGFVDDPVTGREYVMALGATSVSNDSKYDCVALPASPGYTYDQFFSESAAKGVTGYRIFLDGGEGTAEQGQNHLGLEPIPVGRYYVYDQCITGNFTQGKDPNGVLYKAQIDGLDLLTNYPNCRYPNFTDTNCGVVYGSKLRRSLVTRMLSAADAHGVKVKLTLFSGVELDTPSWDHATYNLVNGGPVATAREFFNNATALDWQKKRVNFVMQVWGDSPAIWVWDLYNELEFAPGAQSDRLDWANKMTVYIKQIDSHHRPVSSSSYIPPDWAAYAPMNARYTYASHDLVDYHVYNLPVLSDLVSRLRRAEVDYGKTVFVGEFWPWTAQFTGTEKTGLLVEPGMQQTPPYEDKPYRPSLLQNWVQLMSSGSSVGARWQSVGMNGISGLDKYTLAPIYQSLSRFISQVDWGRWNFATSIAWEDKITATNTDLLVGRGDGDQVILLIHATADTSNVVVSGLTPGMYTVKTFDYITGNLLQTSSMVSSGNSVNFTVNIANSFLDKNGDGYDRKRLGVVLMEAVAGATLTPTIPPIGGGPTATRTPSPTRTPTPTRTLTPIPLLGDINADRVVNALDYVLLFESFTRRTGDALYNPKADIAPAGGDGIVNALDYVVLFENFGRMK